MLHEDRQGRLWFNAYSGGLCYYDYERDIFTQHPLNDTLRQLHKGWVRSLYFDDGDTLWYAQDMFKDEGLHKIYGNSIEKARLDSSLFNGSALAYVKELSDGAFVYGKTFSRTDHDVNYKYLPGKNGTSYLQFPKSDMKNSRCVRLKDSSFLFSICLLYTSPSPRDPSISRMPSSA